jgi:hypothetical protein
MKFKILLHRTRSVIHTYPAQITVQRQEAAATYSLKFREGKLQRDPPLHP